jgi:hypothetical protein
MKTRLALIFSLTVFASGTLLFSQPVNQSIDTLSLILKNSKNNNKSLFLIFGWEGCGWCRAFDKFHNDTSVKSILSKYITISTIDIYKSNACQYLYKKYGKGGTPSWTIFNQKGEFVIDSDNGKGNIGYPTEESDFDYYIKAIKKVAPDLSDNESAILIGKFKEYKNKRERTN